MKTSILYIVIVFCATACIVRDKPAQDKFIALSGGLHLDGLKLLILKIDKPQWKIGYRYGAECKPAERQNGKALTEAISASLRTWLKPLKELQPARPITDSFVYQLQADFSRNQPEDLEGLRAVDLRVTFRCIRGNSHAPIGRIFPPAVVMQLGTEITPALLSILTHELGHTFGLADTYARPGIMRSRGGLPWTSGTQPASIMVGGFRVDTPLAISEDDKRGIVWLYKYFYEDLATDDCFFSDYVFEKEPRGCVPKYPLIFETKHSPPLYALRLLKEDPTIDINAQDDAGMTALHYAVMYEKEEIVKALLAHQDIKPSLKDKQGRDALQLAREIYLAKTTELLQQVANLPDGDGVEDKLAEIIALLQKVVKAIPPRRKEDVNGDGVVNILDLVAVAAKFGQKDAGNADINGDGTVDIRDLVLVAGAFGTVAAAPALQAEARLTAATVAGWLSAAQKLTLPADYARGLRKLQQLHAHLAPSQTALLSNYPNPFNPETWLPYQLAKPAKVSISIFTAQGKLVRTLVLGHQSAGMYQDRSRAAHWDGRNAQGELVASGVYFYTLSAGDFTATRKMLLRK